MIRALLLAVAIIGGALLGASCTVTKGPFVPRHAMPCRSDVDCKPGTSCRFPGVDTHPVCMPGENALDRLPALGEPGAS